MSKKKPNKNDQLQKLKDQVEQLAQDYRSAAQQLAYLESSNSDLAKANFKLLTDKQALEKELDDLKNKKSWYKFW